MNIFLGLHPEGITVFLGFGSDCSLFSQKEFPWGSSWIWFVTSESWHLEVCQASAFGWYTLPFNGNLPPPLPTHTQFQVGGTTFFFFFWENYCYTVTHQLCMSSHSAVGCVRCMGHAAASWMHPAQQNLRILLLTYGLALYLKFTEFIWARRAWRWWNSQPSKPRHSTPSLSPDFPCTWHDGSIKPRVSACCLVLHWLQFT